MQLPPPIHGPCVMNNIVYNSNIINNTFNLRAIPLRFARLDDIGNFSLKKIIVMLKTFFAIFQGLFFFSPDLVYFTISPAGASFYRDAFYVCLIKLFRKKIVFHLHGKGIKQSTKRKIAKVIYSYVLKDSFIILLSSILATDIEEIFFNKKRLHILPNGIPEIECPKKKSEKHELLKILYFSNIKISKGVLNLLEAAKLLKSRGNAFKLQYVGGIGKSISENEFRRKISEMNLTGYVEYLGPKYGEEKAKIFCNSDFFVFPTFKDAFPIVIIEAMQAGIPVISTYEGAISEIVDHGKTGFLVQPHKIIDLEKKMEILLKNSKLREAMGKRGREKYLAKYTATKFETNLNSIFQKIIYECNT